MDEPLKGSKDYHTTEDNKYTQKNFLQIGSIHGLKYLARRQKCETLFFAFVLLVSLALSTIFIWFLSYPEMRASSKVQSQPIHNLPFAAVTICPETKAKKSLINFTDAYKIIHAEDQKNNNLTHEQLSYIEAMSQVCDAHLFDKINITASPTPGEDFADILRELEIDDSVLFCKFRQEIVDCDEYFKETITDVGLCKTFNMLPAMKKDSENSSWSSSFGYESEDFNVFPRRAFKGSSIGLNVVLSQESSDLDYICIGPVQGWKVKIHSPDEFPSMSSGFVRVPLNMGTTIEVKPEVTLKSGSSCHSTASKPLKYFSQYSQENCMTECLSSFVLSRCGCVRFSMIHDDETSICNQHKTKCVARAVNEFSTTFRFKEDFSCNCKSSCSSVKYNTNVYQASYDSKNVLKAYQEDSEFSSASMSRLDVYFEDDYYVPKIESLSSDSLIDVVAKVGGILAFFLGASWISIIEVFYHLFRRFTC